MTESTFKHYLPPANFDQITNFMDMGPWGGPAVQAPAEAA
jgi:hypothetical protein